MCKWYFGRETAEYVKSLILSLGGICTDTALRSRGELPHYTEILQSIRRRASVRVSFLLF